MAKPSTPDVWASGKAFAFQPSQAQQAQGFDYIATVRPSTGAPITDDHDWPLNKITTALKWTMDQLPDGGLKYGCPLVGSLIHWPLQQMPQEIWPDCGMTFIPYIGQAFDQVKYPLLKALHPSGVLPADMRGEFARGWDNGRDVDTGRVLMSAQGDAMRALTGSFTGTDMANQAGATGVFSSSATVATPAAESFSSAAYHRRIDFSTAGVVPTAGEFRSRSIAWNMIVRAA